MCPLPKDAFMLPAEDPKKRAAIKEKIDKYLKYCLEGGPANKNMEAPQDVAMDYSVRVKDIFPFETRKSALAWIKEFTKRQNDRRKSEHGLKEILYAIPYIEKISHIEASCKIVGDTADKELQYLDYSLGAEHKLIVDRTFRIQITKVPHVRSHVEVTTVIYGMDNKGETVFQKHLTNTVTNLFIGRKYLASLGLFRYLESKETSQVFTVKSNMKDLSEEGKRKIVGYIDLLLQDVYKKSELDFILHFVAETATWILYRPIEASGSFRNFLDVISGNPRRFQPREFSLCPK